MSLALKDTAEMLLNDHAFYARNCLKVRAKDGSIQSLNLNKLQIILNDKIEAQLKAKGKVRVILLKGRQGGATTFVQSRFFRKINHGRGLRAFILTHRDDATANIFKITKRFHDNLPAVLRLKTAASSAKEIIYAANDCSYGVGTANAKGTGRGDTIQLFHGSEVGFWDNAEDHATGILQCIPDAQGTEIILESTANGVGNRFHHDWLMAQSGESGYEPIFLPWYLSEEYQIAPGDEPVNLSDEEQFLVHNYKISIPQVLWRRAKVIELKEKRFKQEYPFNPDEAFQHPDYDSFIDSDAVVRARKCEAHKFGPLLIGVDPARKGKDRFSIIRRQGRVAYGMEYHKGLTQPEAIHKLVTILKKENPKRMYVDVGKDGWGIVDALHEKGYDKIVVPVDFGSSPIDKRKYANKRAEMWGRLNDWLHSPPCQIPDSDELHADLCAPSFKYTSNSQIQLESKKEIPISPDGADALAETFFEEMNDLVDNEEPLKFNLNVGGWQS